LVETAALADAISVDTSIAALPGEGALLLGGRDGSGAPIDAQWLVTLAPIAPRLQLLARPPLPTRRAAPAALVLPSGLVWLAAGVDASDPTFRCASRQLWRCPRSALGNASRRLSGGTLPSAASSSLRNTLGIPQSANATISHVALRDPSTVISQRTPRSALDVAAVTLFLL